MSLFPIMSRDTLKKGIPENSALDNAQILQTAKGGRKESVTCTGLFLDIGTSDANCHSYYRAPGVVDNNDVYIRTTSMYIYIYICIYMYAALRIVSIVNSARHEMHRQKRRRPPPHRDSSLRSIASRLVRFRGSLRRVSASQCAHGA